MSDWEMPNLAAGLKNTLFFYQENSIYGLPGTGENG